MAVKCIITERKAGGGEAGLKGVFIQDDVTTLIYELRMMNGEMYYQETSIVRSVGSNKPIMTDDSTSIQFCLGIDNGNLYVMEV